MNNLTPYICIGGKYHYNDFKLSTNETIIKVRADSGEVPGFYKKTNRSIRGMIVWEWHETKKKDEL